MFPQILTDGAAPRAARIGLTRRNAGGPYGWLTPYIAEMAAASPTIASRALSLPRDELHFIALTLALTPEDARTPGDIAALATAIGSVKREAILAAHTTAEPRLARYCPKLAGKPWRATTYRRLAALHAEPHARKTLAHLPAITRRVVLTLSRLPPPYRTPGVLRMIGKPKNLSRVLFAIEIVRRVRTDLTDRQIIASLERTDSGYIRTWTEGHYERLPFPRAPVGVLADGRGAVLRPMNSAAELKRASADFRNCLDGRVRSALTGQSVYYRCDIDGKPAAALELDYIPGFGWAIYEIAGVDNDEVGGDARERAIDLLASAGVAAMPQARSPHRAW